MNKIYAECVNSNGGGGNGSLTTVVGGIAPKACTNFTVLYQKIDQDNTLQFQWEDTDDTYWGGCRIVVKKDSAPENLEDGFFVKDSYTLNAYKTDPLTVQIHESGTYYATLFPFSTTSCVNQLKVNVVNLDVELPKSFADYTWEEISEISISKQASALFSIGDIKPLVSLDGNTYNMEITNITDTYGIVLYSNDLLPNKCISYGDDYDHDTDKYGGLYERLGTNILNTLIPTDMHSLLRDSEQFVHFVGSNSDRNFTNKILTPVVRIATSNIRSCNNIPSKIRNIVNTNTPQNYIVYSCGSYEYPKIGDDDCIYNHYIDTNGNITQSVNTFGKASELYTTFGFCI